MPFGAPAISATAIKNLKKSKASVKATGNPKTPMRPKLKKKAATKATAGARMRPKLRKKAAAKGGSASKPKVAGGSAYAGTMAKLAGGL